jgi:transposase
VTRKTQTRSPRRSDTQMRTARRPWPLDVRMAVARGVVDEGLPASQVAARVGVPYTTALMWAQRYRAGGAAALEATVRRVSAKADDGNYQRVFASVAADWMWPTQDP